VGYETRGLAKDIVTMMDSLHIQQAHLVGWSAGGYEIARFAELYPNRIEAAVFLDTDCPGHADELPTPPDSLPEVPSVPDLEWGNVNLVDVITWFVRRYGPRPPGSLLEIIDWDSDGQALGFKIKRDLLDGFYKHAVTEDFNTFSKPALALIARSTHPVNVFGTFYYEMTSTEQENARQILAFKQSVCDSAIAQWHRMPENVEVVVLEEAPHAMFIWNPYLVANHVRSFLKEVD
jgi:pimeloyl-ACP methyl ester carboxylesterase